MLTLIVVAKGAEEAVVGLVVGAATGGVVWVVKEAPWFVALLSCRLE